MYYPPPPSPQRGGFARAIFTTLAVSVLGFSITLNIYLLLMNGVFSGETSPTKRTILQAGDASQIVAVFSIDGPIFDQTIAEIEPVIADIEAESGVKAIVLEINSPGGGVTASDILYDRLLRLKKKSNVPLVISMGALATSGGYYVACAGDHVIAQRTTWTGNIGVLFPRVGVSELAKKWGIEDTTLASTGADFKDAGSALREETPEERAYWQGLIDEAFVAFKDVVIAGRKLDRATVDKIANGKVYSASEALKLKLIDQVGYFDDAVAKASAMAGLSGAQVVRFERQVGFWDALAGANQTASVSPMIQTRVGGTTIQLDRKLASDILSPRPLYLYRGQ
jgi:protease-4